MLVLAASLQPVCSQALQSASISESDTIKYIASPPGQLAVVPGAPLLTILQGSAGAAGGNVALFASSDSGAFLSTVAGSPFSSVAPTVITATFDNAQVVTVGSLNANDWFTVAAGGDYNTGYGVDNLANQWFGDFLGSMVAQGNGSAPGLIAGNEQNLYSSLLANGGFAQNCPTLTSTTSNAIRAPSPSDWRLPGCHPPDRALDRINRRRPQVLLPGWIADQRTGDRE